ncbi:MAG: hypothetical protein ABEJ58_02115 [Halodesulfurarchaeum sp.]
MSLEMDNRRDTHVGRYYGGIIAIIVGAYSFLLGMLSMQFSLDVVLVVLGFLIGIHGAVMITPLADRFPRVNEALMVIFGALVIGYQAYQGTIRSVRGSGIWVNPGYDMGMVALGLILFLAGAIMFFMEEM